jgi:hypothetical protein
VRRRSFQKVGMQFSSTFVNILAQVMKYPQVSATGTGLIVPQGTIDLTREKTGTPLPGTGFFGYG